uniref:cGMP-dependent protein kinase n=1 Tax=Periophthalmus magnuspinnatus TaxID=409849 RepID=A0A3B4ANG5_9GOBI
MGNGSVKSRLRRDQGPQNGRAVSQSVSSESYRSRLEELQREGLRKDEKINSLQGQVQSLLGAGVGSGLGSGLSSRPCSVRISSGQRNRRRGAKAGVSAEPSSRTDDSRTLPKFNMEQARVPKDPSVQGQLLEALMKNQYLRRLDPQPLRLMVECMYARSYQQGELVTQQGERGHHLFVLAEGKLEVLQNQRLLSSLSPWTTFGELAILYNCTRTASIRAVDSVETWALDREVFQNIMRRTAETRQEEHRDFLRSVSILRDLPEEKLSKMVDCLDVEYYDRGEYIIREGEEGSTFYIIAQGKVAVTQSTEGRRSPVLINTLQKGDYFGEKALISDDVRSANIVADEDGVECLVIDRETFDQTVGTFSELQKYLQGYVATLERDDRKRHAKRSLSRLQSQPLSPDQAQLRDLVSGFCGSKPFQHLELVSTLGVGGFGRVELVKLKDQDMSFALKVIKKHHVVENRQQEHIHSERRILSEARSPFIVKLYRTFKDDKYVYMLLEACLGGEVWSLLRDRYSSFDESTSRFCVSCVTEALEYLHRKSIVYRDLKPENLLLDTHGYCKLVDFGFAKRLGPGQKTWTFCGTPEYVAPEILLSKGHSFSVDFWALGVLLFELLTGSPPFSGADHMTTYSFILRGVEKIDFPKKINKKQEDLIRKLCRKNPAERLGNLKNGITDIKKHRWFSGFNWSGLKSRTVTSPLKREISGPLDHSYFDSYPPDEDHPPDELSGWDQDF